MTNLTTDLLQDGDFFEELTLEELDNHLAGGATAAGSVSAGQYSQTDGVVTEDALTAAVAVSDDRPFQINLAYSFEPRLSVAARVYFP